MSNDVPIKGGGIYLILNLINGKMYVGRTSKFQRRRQDHFLALSRNIHDNDYLQKSWNKYGKENFVFITLKLEELNIKRKELEIYYSWLFGTFKRDRGYNINENPDVPMDGRHHTKEVKEKLAEIRTKTKA